MIRGLGCGRLGLRCFLDIHMEQIRVWDLGLIQLQIQCGSYQVGGGILRHAKHEMTNWR